MRLSMKWSASMEVTPSPRGSRSKRGKLCQIIVLLALATALLSIVVLFGVADACIEPRMTFSIILDAGTSGSRMSVYSLQHKNGFYELQNNNYGQLEPGLSSYADEPQKGALSLKPLLDKALNYVPEPQQSSTTISLKATAGLRSLPPQKQQRLLDEVRKLIEKYPFAVNNRSVEILDGTIEGFYSWITVAFLLGKNIFSNDIAALDLGGGSTQVSCLPGPGTAAERPDHVHDMQTIGGKTVRIYSHSYADAGLMSARRGILSATSKSYSSTPQNPCVSSADSTKQSHGVIETSNAQHDDFEQCHGVVKSFVSGLKMFRLRELQTRDVYLMSYFFDSAVEAGLVTETDGPKPLQVEDFLNKATEECEKRNDVKDGSKFLCLDLTFIYTLLSEGLGMNNNSRIWVVRTIHETDVSWTLGAALSNLQP